MVDENAKRGALQPAEPLPLADVGIPSFASRGPRGSSRGRSRRTGRTRLRKGPVESRREQQRSACPSRRLLCQWHHVRSRFDTPVHRRSAPGHSPVRCRSRQPERRVDRCHPDPHGRLDEFARPSPPGQRANAVRPFPRRPDQRRRLPGVAGLAARPQAADAMARSRGDPSFAVGGAASCQGNVPDAGVHILDAGHLALDAKVDEITHRMRTFLARQQDPSP